MTSTEQNSPVDYKNSVVINLHYYTLLCVLLYYRLSHVQKVHIGMYKKEKKIEYNRGMSRKSTRHILIKSTYNYRLFLSLVYFNLNNEKNITFANRCISGDIVCDWH